MNSSEYYGVATTPTSDFLAHYGVQGMKWGVRKAVNKTGSGGPKSVGYKKAEKKLMKAQLAGGLLGSAVYAARHKDEIKKASSERLGNKSKNSTSLNSDRGPGSSKVKGTKQTRHQAQLHKQAQQMREQADKAYEEVNRSFLGRHGFGKKAKAYKEAMRKATNAQSDYYRSLNKKQYASLRRKHDW
jgi:hypothetical protein